MQSVFDFNKNNWGMILSESHMVPYIEVTQI